MSDSFTELVERYRRELARYGRQSSPPPLHSEPETATTAEPEPAGPPEVSSAPAISAEPTPEPPQEAAPEPETAADEAETAAPPGVSTEPEPSNLPSSALCHPDDTDTAALVVQVYTARQAIPVPEADVSVYCGDGSGNVLISFRTTNADGKTDSLLLSAPDRAFSESPDSPERPYAVYRVRVDHPQYISETLEDVQLFGGVESILPVGLTPYVPIDEPKPLRTIALPGHSLEAETEANQP